MESVRRLVFKQAGSSGRSDICDQSSNWANIFRGHLIA